VVFVGRLLPHKGIDYLIAAVPNGQRLVIIGRPYHNAYYQLLRELAKDKQVDFVTDATDDRVVAELRRSAVAVVPSVYSDCYGNHYAAPELFGLSAVEAMSCETPVICSDVGSLPEIIEDGVTGLVVPPNEPGALRGAIERIMNDPRSAREMGKAARRRVLELFTWDRVAETCLRVYATAPWQENPFRR
jgi:glycosyltransferase involved in cell wall biosynthesis